MLRIGNLHLAVDCFDFFFVSGRVTFLQQVDFLYPFQLIHRCFADVLILLQDLGNFHHIMKFDDSLQKIIQFSPF